MLDAGLFDEELGAFQDFDLYLRLAQICEFAYVDESLVIRHKHAGERITKGDANRIAAAEAIYRKHEHVLAQEPRLRSAYLALQGRQHVTAGNRREALAKLLGALRADPTQVDLVGHMVLAALGPDADRTVRRMTRPIRRGIGSVLKRVRGG
jgi:hypothetical protein